MRILIVDDDSAKMEGIKKTLNSLGYNNIDTASSRAGMVEFLQNNSFDLVVLDNNFPLYEGSSPKRNLGIDILHMLEATLVFPRLFKDAKVILCSSDDIEESFEYENYLGNIVYDLSVDAREPFSKLLKEE